LKVSNVVFRDPSAHYHVAVACDTGNGTPANRLRIYVNGVEITSWSSDTNYPVSQEPSINWYLGSRQHYIGDIGNGTYLDGYLSEINFIDGQSLTPADFGEFNPDGVWVPKKYTGTYGTNGFYLPFDNGDSPTTLGHDRSGNGNNWTATGISTTSGATYDWMDDTPTNNFCTLNPLSKSSAMVSPSNGNLTSATSGTQWGYTPTTVAVSGGKWHFEATMSGYVGAGTHRVGWMNIATESALNCPFTDIDSNRTVSIAVDFGAKLFWVATNGEWAGDPSAGTGGASFTSTAALCPFLDDTSGASGNNCTWNINFGQRPFAYTPPTGFKALCTKNLPVTSITTYGSFTGNLSTNGPFVWLKGNPETMTINGNAVTWGTHADKTAGGFKVRSSSSSYNNTGTNTYSVTYTGNLFGDLVHAPNTAKGNP
jgi:hypothetical protein